MVDFISSTDIANMALSHLAVDTIENFTDQKVQGVQVRTWYDYSRRMALEAFDWNFARKRQTAALHSDEISETDTDPLAGVWGFRYQYPGDCLIVRKLQNSMAPPGDAYPFEIETSLDGSEKTIVTDVEDAVIVYTWDQENISAFSSIFVLAFSHLLAHHMAHVLTRKSGYRRQQLALYQGVLIGAQATSANESVGKPPRDADWVRLRQ